jgi:hypothetical protein
MRRPLAVRKEVFRRVAGVDEPVVALHDLVALATLERGEEKVAVCVVRVAERDHEPTLRHGCERAD